MKVIILATSSIIVLLISWGVYASIVSGTTLADLSRCSPSTLTKAVNVTRQLLHVKTGDDINTELLNNASDPLKMDVRYACPSIK